MVIQLSSWNGTPINEVAYIRNNADHEGLTGTYFGCSSDVKDLLYYKTSNHSLWIKIPNGYIGSLIVIPVQGASALFTEQTDTTGLTKII